MNLLKTMLGISVEKLVSISIKLLILILIFTTLVFRQTEGLGVKSILSGIDLSQFASKITTIVSTPFSIRGSIGINQDLNIIRSLGIDKYYLENNIAPPVMYEAEFLSALYPMQYKGRWGGDSSNQDLLILINKTSKCPNHFIKYDLNNFSYCYNFN